MALLRGISRACRWSGELAGKCSVWRLFPPPSPSLPFHGGRILRPPLSSTPPQYYLGAPPTNSASAPPQRSGGSSKISAPRADLLGSLDRRERAAGLRGATEAWSGRVPMPQRGGAAENLVTEVRSYDFSYGTAGFTRPPRRGVDAARHHGSALGTGGSCRVAHPVHDGFGFGPDYFALTPHGAGLRSPILASTNLCLMRCGGSRRQLTGVPAASLWHGLNASPHIYMPRNWLSSWRGGHVPPPQERFWMRGRTALRRPEFLPSQMPDPGFSMKKWRIVQNVPGIVHEACVGVTSFHVKFDPRRYFRTHPITEKVPVLGEPCGTFLCKYTEGAKYSSKSLIDLIGTFHDMDVCIPTLSVESVVINSAGKIELILHKTRFTKLTREGVDNDYRNAVLVFEELIADTMGKEMIALIPEGIKLLFNYMRTDGYQYRYLIAVHVSLLPLEALSPVYMAFFDYIAHCIPSMDRKLMEEVEDYIPYRKLWAIKASNNRHMVQFLRYQDEWARKLYWGSTKQLLKIVRNVIAHKMELLRRGELYKAEEVDNMLLSLFHVLLPRMQLFFWEQKRLRRFKLEAYFVDRKVTWGWRY